MLSLRPERVALNPAEGECDTTVTGKVEELIYLGDHIRCRLSVHGQNDFIVKVPNAQGHKHLVEGETTQVSWVTEDCRALDA